MPAAFTITFSILYVFFWVFPRRLIVVFRRFGTLYLFHLHRLDVKYPAYEDGTECSETSAYNNQTPGKYPKEYIQNAEMVPKIPSCHYMLLM